MAQTNLSIAVSLSKIVANVGGKAAEAQGGKTVVVVCLNDPWGNGKCLIVSQVGTVTDDVRLLGTRSIFSFSIYRI